ncbi:hypothetical protein TMatcc_003285 [Talaromyces marneffei ATCC 18224]|uniref:Tetratricopeptide repeat protein 36 n=2 Tax=Talaromyces marneffei TaxID=37727 RepID=B6Q565_TALMQ|nr:uncharacterized protein EYB26_001652 [Talaromyces marneffei]EEA28384.1 conserved hypothetical protein [Talaromyces marneffei ATCC 18224]KAE8555983.1 hypothetical protein EYB25_000682 [Talaromyces marneffei]QGA14000.1 hypothetical protein EYB26_001652 [Talaromyces marneffei]
MASAATITAPKMNLKLTSNDSAVLQALFDNGEGSFPIPSSTDTSLEHTAAADSQAINIDDSLPAFPRCSIEEAALSSLKDRELAIIHRIQTSSSTSSTTYSTQEASSSSTPNHILEQAIADLSSLITEHPDYPPLYANRAQALRLLIQSKNSDANDTDKDAAIFHPANKDLATKLLSDLSKAISLASPVPTGANGDSTNVSSAQHRLLSNTHMHRGYLLLKAGKICKEEEKDTNETGNQERGGPNQLLGITSRDQLEEMASQDFFEAGRYGNEVAKQLSVGTNPYAKMCGAIVKEALKKEIEEFQS